MIQVMVRLVQDRFRVTEGLCQGWVRVRLGLVDLKRSVLRPSKQRVSPRAPTLDACHTPLLQSTPCRSPAIPFAGRPRRTRARGAARG